MSTSNSYDFNLTRDQIIASSLRLIGVVGEGQTPTADQISNGAEALNYVLKSWTNQGAPIWCVKSVDIPLTANVTEYSIGPTQTVNVAKPLKIYQAYRRTTNTIDIPLIALSKQQYNMLGKKDSVGAPSQYYYDQQRDIGVVSVFPTPDATTASTDIIRVFYQRPFEDFDSSTDNPDVPQEFLRALKYALANELSFEYGIPGNDRMDLERKTQMLVGEAFAYNAEEASFFFKVDRQGW